MIKFTISIRFLTTFAVILTFYNAVFSQFEKYTIPAKWELYSVKDKNVSFLMPRLPVLIERERRCQGEQIQEYGAYHDGVVYVFRITSKIEPAESCSPKRNFDDNNFIERVNSLKTEFKDFSNSENNSSKNSIIKLVGTNKVVQIVNDYDNQRWLELAIYGSDEKKAEVKNFLASLKTNKETTGKVIGEGAAQTFGDDVSKSIIQIKAKNTGNDESVAASERTVVKINDDGAYLARIILQPKAKFTDAARQNQVQGTVKLKVEFLANGAIGNVIPFSGLPFGLTQEAIAAARKMVFIPEQSFGNRYSVMKTVEYSFNLY